MQRLLGHRSISNTLRYVQLGEVNGVDSYHVRTTRDLKEAEQLVEAGYEFVCKMPDDSRVFRKRK